MLCMLFTYHYRDTVPGGTPTFVYRFINYTVQSVFPKYLIIFILLLYSFYVIHLFCFILFYMIYDFMTNLTNFMTKLFTLSFNRAGWVDVDTVCKCYRYCQF